MHKITLIVRLSGTFNLLTGDHIYGCQKMAGGDCKIYKTENQKRPFDADDVMEMTAHMLR